MPNSWINNKKVIWLCLLVYLLTGLGSACANFPGADIITYDERSSSCQNTSKTFADNKLDGHSLGTTPCAPDGDGNCHDYHLPIKSRLRIPRILTPSCAVFWSRDQTINQVKDNGWNNSPLQISALQPPQSLRQLRTIVLLN